MKNSISIPAARRGFYLFIITCLLFVTASVSADLYNNEDLAEFAEEWQQSCSSGNNWCNGYDYDISGTVDEDDLARFANIWLTSKDWVLSDDIADWIVDRGYTTGLDTYKWNYDRGFVLLSLYEKWLVKPDPTYLEFIKAWVDDIIQPDGSIVPPGNPTYYQITKYNQDHIQPGNLLVFMYELFGDNKYLLAMNNNLIVQLNQQPTTYDGGFWHKSNYPYQMWLDGLYMTEPFVCRYAQLTGDSSWYDVAGFQLTKVAEHTQHSQIYGSGTGLCYHGWDSSALETPPQTPRGWAHPTYYHSPEFWGRAVGWYTMALVDCLDLMPPTHPDRTEMLTVLSDLAASLVPHQDATTGMWYQVLDKGTLPDNWVETSCSLMFSYAFARAVEAGYLPEVPYLAASRTAFEGVVANKLSYSSGYIVLTGTVSVGSLGGYNSYSGGYSYYVNSGTTTNDIKGVGAFMRAALQYEKMTP